jgi:hypothetical protein
LSLDGAATKGVDITSRSDEIKTFFTLKGDIILKCYIHEKKKASKLKEVIWCCLRGCLFVLDVVGGILREFFIKN